MDLVYGILVGSLVLFAIIGLITKNHGFTRFGGRLGISLLFLLFGSLHFIQTELVAQMLPPFVPFRELIALATGVWEVLLAILLLLPVTQRRAAWAVIITLVAFYPANIYTFMAEVPVPSHGSLMEFLLIRTPLQPLMIIWTWWFAIREQK